MDIQIKRTYDPKEDDDGYRVLVDRLWPGGIAKKDAEIGVELIHIADAVGSGASAHGYGTLGLPGTRFTMKGDFYRARLLENHGIKTVIPDAGSRDLVHRIIYEELCMGIISESSRQRVESVAERLVEVGAQVVVLGCTELPILLTQDRTNARLLDSTTLHAEAAVAAALKDDA